MKKNILFPTDFSDNAWSAVVYALKLYAEEECNMYFLHTLKMKASSMSNLSNKLLVAMSNNAMKDLKELKRLAQHSNGNANHDFEIILSSRGLEDAINDAIKKHNIDLVVMGTKGATGAKEFFFGSNTVKIIKKTRQCPVLIVPDEFDFEAPKQIAFPTDFKRFYGEELEPLKDIASLFDSKIRILHISEEDNLTKSQDYNLAMLKVYLEDFPHSFHWMPDYDAKSEEINDFIKDQNINILFMIKYKHSLIEKIIKEPVVNKIGFQPTIPFLVITQND